MAAKKKKAKAPARRRAPAEPRVGFVDASGALVIAARYRYAGEFSEGLAVVQEVEGGPMGAIDPAGEVAIPPRFGWLGAFHEGLAPFSAENVPRAKRGYVDREGRVVVEPCFDDAGAHSEGLAAVKIGDSWGFVDRSGQLVIAPTLRSYGMRFSEGLVRAWGLAKPSPRGIARYGFLGPDGKWAIEEGFDDARDFHEGLAAVRVTVGDAHHPRDVWGFLDRTGTLAIEPRFELAHDFSEGLALVNSGARRDLEGRSSRDHWYVSGEAMGAYTDGEWGFVDRAGALAIPLRHASAVGPFREGLARVTDGVTVTFVDRTGAVVVTSVKDGIPRFFEPCGDFAEGRALVSLGSKKGFIDRSGEVVIACRYSAARGFREGRAAVAA